MHDHERQFLPLSKSLPCVSINLSADALCYATLMFQNYLFFHIQIIVKNSLVHRITEETISSLPPDIPGSRNYENKTLASWNGRHIEKLLWNHTIDGLMEGLWYRGKPTDRVAFRRGSFKENPNLVPSSSSMSQRPVTKYWLTQRTCCLT